MNATAGDEYNHPSCDRCWYARHPRRDPVRAVEPRRGLCCWCGEPTKSGIFVREDPWELPKHTAHKGHAAAALSEPTR